MVLLKNKCVNNKPLLPLDFGSDTTIAVIGFNANRAVISGGGSAFLRPTDVKASPLEGIKHVFKELGGNVDNVQYSPGVVPWKFVPLEDSSTVAKGRLQFWNQSPSETFMSSEANLVDPLPPSVLDTTPFSSALVYLDDLAVRILVLYCTAL